MSELTPPKNELLIFTRASSFRSKIFDNESAEALSLRGALEKKDEDGVVSFLPGPAVALDSDGKVMPSIALCLLRPRRQSPSPNPHPTQLGGLLIRVYRIL